MDKGWWRKERTRTDEKARVYFCVFCAGQTVSHLEIYRAVRRVFLGLLAAWLSCWWQKVPPFMLQKQKDGHRQSGQPGGPFPAMPWQS